MLYGLRDSNSLDGWGKAKRCPSGLDLGFRCPLPPDTTYLTLPRILLTLVLSTATGGYCSAGAGLLSSIVFAYRYLGYGAAVTVKPKFNAI